MGMGKYGSSSSFEAQQQRKMKEERQKIHPIWRGVGFLLMALTPVLGYFAGVVLLDENAKQNWFVIPAGWLASGNDPLLYVKIGLTVVLGLVIFLVFQFFSVIILQIFGPPRYGPYDVPSVTYKGKKRSR